MQELFCSWVPGTVDIVRLKLGKRHFEMTSARLSKIFGPHALAELYLRGRVVLKAEERQVASLT